MKIEDKRPYNYKRFRDIDTGTCFEWDHSPFLKVKDYTKAPYGVAFHSGDLLSFEGDEKVIPLKNVKVIIGE